MCCRVAVYPVVSAEHVARGVSAKLWVDHLVSRAGRGKGECAFWYIATSTVSTDIFAPCVEIYVVCHCCI